MDLHGRVNAGAIGGVRGLPRACALGHRLSPLSGVAHTCRLPACMRSQHSVHREEGSIIQKIESPTGPRPVTGFFNQLASDRIGVHVVQFFLSLLGTPDVHVIAPALPDPEVSVMVDAGRQPHSAEHLLAPGIARIIFQILQDKQGSAVLKLL